MALSCVHLNTEDNKKKIKQTFIFLMNMLETISSSCCKQVTNQIATMNAVIFFKHFWFLSSIIPKSSWYYLWRLVFIKAIYNNPSSSFYSVDGKMPMWRKYFHIFISFLVDWLILNSERIWPTIIIFCSHFLHWLLLVDFLPNR